MVHSSHAGAEEEPGRRFEGESGVVEDDFGGEFGVCDASLQTSLVSVASAGGAFGGAERGWDGDVEEEIAGLLVDAVGDCFGGVDGRAAADGDDGVDGVVFLDEFGGFV